MGPGLLTTNLINALAGVIGVHVCVLGSEVSPLEAVHWAKVHFFSVLQPPGIQKLPRTISVPNLDFFVREQLSVGVPSHKPKQLLRHASPEDLFGRQQGKPSVAQTEAHLYAELGYGAGAGTISSCHSVGHNVSQQIQILLLD